jgi:hypothetical protein
MLTANYLVENKLSVDHVLTEQDKKAILLENKNGNYSYLCLMREMFGYKNVTVQSLLQGWGGIKLVKVPEQYKRVKR